jgi:MscS family membrane protein
MTFQYLDQAIQFEQFSFLSDYSPVASTMVVWLSALVVLFIFLAIVKKLSEGSKSDIDDVTIGITSKYITIILLSVGVVSVIFSLDLNSKITDIALTLNNFVVTVSVLVIIWKLVYKEYIQYYLPYLAEKSESNLDDVLLPILQTAFPIVFFVVATLFTLQSLNVDISGWGVIVGGASFVLAFALQNTLADLFAGIALVADAPFGSGDVIKVGDQIAEVKKIGIRVTELYIFDDHSTVFIPNSSLSGESITNLTYPTPDVRARMAVGVGYDSNPRKVRMYMQDMATANPYVIGNPEDKVEAMKKRLDLLQKEENTLEFADEISELTWGIKKWSKEVSLLENVKLFKTFLSKLLSEIDAAEDDGLDDKEISNILNKLKKPGRESLQGVIEITNKWLEENIKDPNLFTQDLPIIQEHWETKMNRLQQRYEAIIKYTEGATLAEKQRIDTKLSQFISWVDEKFKDPYEEWKDPDADFDDMGDNAIVFSFEFFVDDIKSERYERMGRVISDLRRNIFEKLVADGVELPFPQQDVWFRNQIPEKKD